MNDNIFVITEPTFDDVFYMTKLLNWCAAEKKAVFVYDKTMESKYFPFARLTDVQAHLKHLRIIPQEEKAYALKDCVLQYCHSLGINIKSSLDSKDWKDVKYQTRDAFWP